MDAYYNLLVSTLIAFILIIVLFVGFDNRVEEYEDFMGGLWVCDEDFCERAGVDSMMIWVGSPATSWLTTTRNCHILINDDYANQGFVMKYRKNSIVGLPTTHHDYAINAELEFEEDEIMPSPLNITLSMRNNTLRMYDDTTIYGLFYKDHETTDMVMFQTIDKDTKE